MKVIDEIDSFVNYNKSDIIEIFRIPVYCKQTLLVGIANSTSLYSNILEGQSSYKSKQLTFEPYAVNDLQEILKTKILSFSNDLMDLSSIIDPSALRYISQSVSSASGDMRIAFDIIKTSIMHHIKENKIEPITLLEVAKIIKEKHKSKLGKVMQDLPTNQKMICAAIYSKIKVDHKEIFTYKVIFDKLTELLKQCELDRPIFGDFCEQLKMLEFFDVLSCDKKPKVGYTSKV